MFWLIALVGHCLGAPLRPAPVHLRCEYRENPLGIDAPAPHGAGHGKADSTERKWKQAAYEVSGSEQPRWACACRRVMFGIAGKVELRARVCRNCLSKARRWNHVRDTSGKFGYGTQPVESFRIRRSRMVGDGTPSRQRQTGRQSGSRWRNPGQDELTARIIRWIWVAGEDALAAVPETASVRFRESPFDLSERPREKMRSCFLAVREEIYVARGEWAMR